MSWLLLCWQPLLSDSATGAFRFSHVTPRWMELIFAVLKIKAFPCKILLYTFTITDLRNACLDFCPSWSWDSFYLDIYRDVCEFLERELVQVWLVLSVWTGYTRGNSVPSCICESCDADGKSFCWTYSVWLEEVEIIPSFWVICPLVFLFFHCLPPLPPVLCFLLPGPALCCSISHGNSIEITLLQQKMRDKEFIWEH